jgi:hypothetical protein
VAQERKEAEIEGLQLAEVLGLKLIPAADYPSISVGYHLFPTCSVAARGPRVYL